MKNFQFYICIILCIALLPLSVFAANAPIQISTEAQLKNIANNLSGNYILTDDITLSGDWTNIGTSSNYFTGTLDGDGHTISNLNINATKDFKGLFGYAVGATIKNLTIEGNITVYVSTGDACSNVGAFCGGAKDCTFINCTSNVNVKGNKNVGGICGRAYGSSFTNCENNGAIIADENAGGICGRASGCTFLFMRNYGSVLADTYAGGICGIINYYSTYLNTSISKSFNSAAISVNSSRGGGIAGFAQATSGNVSIDDCFNSGNVSSTAQNAYLGGILGDSSHSTTTQATVNRSYNVGKISQNSFSGGISGGTSLIYTNCYYLNNSSLPICANGENLGLFSTSMLSASTYQGFDFSSVWAISTSQDFKYPYLIENPIEFELSITLLEVSSLPYTTTYYESSSNTLDNTNLKLNAYYNDGSVEKNIDSGFTVSTPEFYLGLNPVTVTYKGATTIFPIYVYRSLFEKEALLFGDEYYTPIYSQKNLENISLFPTEKYFLQNNIVCDSSFSGICSQDVPFSGIFLGNNKTITLDIQNADSAALFISASNSSIRDLTIAGSIKGSGVVGALCAYLSNSQISAITNNASILVTPSISASFAGAIAGFSDFSSGSPYVTKCKNFGEITLASTAKTASLGGIIGYAAISTNNTFSLSKSQNFAPISLTSQGASSTDYLGGIIGSITTVSGSGAIELNEVYSAGNLSLTSSAYSYIGGLVGDFNIDSLTKGSLLIQNSFNLGSLAVAGTPLSVTFGGIISTAAYDTVTLSSCYSVASFDVPNTLKGGAIVSNVDFNGTVNNCYYLKNSVADTNATELSLLKATAQASYAGFDFESVWKLDDSFIYPQLLSAPLSLNVTEIKVLTPPQKLNYVQGTEDFSSDGGELLVKFENGLALKAPLSNAQINSFDNSAVGKNTLTVAYLGKTTALDVEITKKPAVLERIEITTPPTKLEYYIGEQFNGNGLTVTAYYDDLTGNNISNYTIEGFDSSTLGTKTITVTFEGKTATFEVKIIERPVLVPDKITSSAFEVTDAFINKISAGTTVEVLLQNINEAEYCLVFNGEQQLNGNEIVATGMLIKLFDGATVKATYTINVTGDLDGNGLVTDADAIYLLYSTFLPTMYPTTQNCDFNKDQSVTDQDAIYLLYSTFLPELYPI